MNSRWRLCSMANMNDCLQNGGVHEFVYLLPYIVEIKKVHDKKQKNSKKIIKSVVLLFLLVYNKIIK